MSVLDPLKKLPQTIEVHCFVQAILDRFLYERMIGYANWAREILAASNLVRENGREEVVCTHALYGRRYSRSPAESKNGQRARGVPSPASAEHRRGQQSLTEHIFHRSAFQKREHELEREGVLLTQRKHQSVIGRSGLQFEVECATEAFPKRESPGACDACAKRRMQHQLHSTGLIEKALRDNSRL